MLAFARYPLLRGDKASKSKFFSSMNSYIKHQKFHFKKFKATISNIASIKKENEKVKFNPYKRREKTSVHLIPCM